jgi:hypothetical protein
MKTNGHDNEKEAPETSSASNPVFSPSDMEERWKKLKAEGRVPALADVLKIVQKATTR